MQRTTRLFEIIQLLRGATGPITADQPLPSREAYAKLNTYLRTGGMIMFDTRDADTARFGSGSPEGRRLQAIARSLDIPPIEPIDHTFLWSSAQNSGGVPFEYDSNHFRR